MATELEPGTVYTIRVTVGNQSTKVGVPVAVTFDVTMISTFTTLKRATVDIPAEGEARIDFPLSLPSDASGEGLIEVEVLTPEGKRVTSGSLEIFVKSWKEHPTFPEFPAYYYTTPRPDLDTIWKSSRTLESGTGYWEISAIEKYGIDFSGVDFTSNQTIENTWRDALLWQVGTVWKTPTSYRTVQVVDFSWFDGFQARATDGVVGIDNSKVVDYMKAQIPTGTPILLDFWNLGSPLAMFGELESSGAADITDIAFDSTGPRWFIRLIIHDIDLFISVIKKYGWEAIG